MFVGNQLLGILAPGSPNAGGAQPSGQLRGILGFVESPVGHTVGLLDGNDE